MLASNRCSNVGFQPPRLTPQHHGPPSKRPSVDDIYDHLTAAEEEAHYRYEATEVQTYMTRKTNEEYLEEEQKRRTLEQEKKHDQKPEQPKSEKSDQ